jgi:hypothetical protein
LGSFGNEPFFLLHSLFLTTFTRAHTLSFFLKSNVDVEFGGSESGCGQFY